MNENGGKNNTILLTVIAIATLLVVVTGATFAYFAAVVKGNDEATSIQITASQSGTQISLEGAEALDLTNIYPRTEAWATKDITLKNTPVAGSSTTATYTFYMNVDTNSFEDGDLQFTFTKKGETESTTKTKLGATGTKGETATSIATGTVNISTANEITYTLKVYFVDNPNKNQNPGEGSKTARFYVSQTWVENNQ